MCRRCVKVPSAVFGLVSGMAFAPAIQYNVSSSGLRRELCRLVTDGLNIRFGDEAVHEMH